jgi:hypothetical protein
VLALYAQNGVLVPTYSKSDLPGAGVGVLRGHSQLVHYFRRFLGKRGLCGRVNTMVEQRFGRAVVYSGLYTFRWTDGGRPKTAKARYTYVTVSTPRGARIVSHHSSAVP